MAEGAVVLPVLAVFFGVMMFVHNSYIAKAQIQNETRFVSFSNAAHACAAGGAQGDVSGIGVPIPAEGNAPNPGKDAALDTSFLKTNANKTTVAVALRRARTVKAESHVYCNPETYSMLETPMAMIDFVKHALGFLGQWGNGWI